MCEQLAWIPKLPSKYLKLCATTFESGTKMGLEENLSFFFFNQKPVWFSSIKTLNVLFQGVTYHFKKFS